MKRLGCEDMHSQKEPDINLLQSAEKARIFALLKSLGLRRAQDHEYSGTPQKKSVLRGEKACGTTEDIDTFEESTDDDLDIDHVDDDDVENELEIHNTYEDISENDLGSVTSVHTFELDTDSDEMKTVPVGPIQEDKDVEKGPFLTWRDGPACKGQGHKNIIGSDC
ncbi:RIKEN cDNA 4930563M21 [Mus musculus]|nr:RIKEN cDNA 4930563M21 [Mus musculus]